MKNEYVYTTFFQFFKKDEMVTKIFLRSRHKKENIAKLENHILMNNINQYDKVCISWTANPNINSKEDINK